MKVDAIRERAGSLADEGDLRGALAIVRGARQGVDRAGQAELRIEEAGLVARGGDLDEALEILVIAASLALGSPAAAAEAAVMRASVLGALGRFEEALPVLRRAVRELEELDAPGLLADARAELRAFENLTSPKHRGTWAALTRRR